MRPYRFALRPGWLALHVVTVALIVTMVLLGRWQLIVSNNKGFDIQNFGYALQWWLFCVFVGVMWCRIIRDHARRAAPSVAHQVDAAFETAPKPPVDEPVAYRRYVVPAASAQAVADDPVYSSYNDYLARLNAEDE